MNFNISEKTILLSLAGSHSYDMAIPGQSDVDVRGIAIAPFDIRISSFHRFEQYEGVWVNGLHELPGFNISRYTDLGFEDLSTDFPEDVVIYDIAKAIKLIGECNPNMLEILFCDENDYLFVSPLGQKLIDVREKFLTLRAKPRYVGYARSQLSKIERHRGYLLGGVPKKPTRSEYKLPEHESLIPQAERNLIDEEVQNKIREWSADNIEMGDAERITLSENLRSFMCATMKVSDKELDEKLEDTAADSLGFDQDIREILRRERGYRNALKSWKSYQKWEKERNPKRKALEEKFGFDCYLDDTEFLTENGWKRYGEISDNEKLATLNQNTEEIEYQNFTERVCKDYSGPIGFIHTRNSRCAVTLNHRMLVSPCRRSRENNFSTEYDSEKSEWEIKSLKDIIDGKRSHFHIRVSAKDSNNSSWNEAECQTYKSWQALLDLIGSYVSEGCVGKRTVDGNASVVRISQKKGGRLCEFFERFWNNKNFLEDDYGEITDYGPISVCQFEHLHDEDWRKEPCKEIIWTVANKKLATKLEEWCGDGSKSKKLPKWISKLDKIQVKYLLQSMIAGDGTNRKYSDTYHTSSKQLADDIQKMCLNVGIVSHIWGPYEPHGMYQVYIGPEKECDSLNVNEENSQNFNIEHVKDRKIVCFTVPNEILVTRREGKIAIQGNTKHASHLIRLCRMGVEILRDGELKVRRDDADELLAIRRGERDFDSIQTEAGVLFGGIEQFYKENPKNLPKKMDAGFLDSLTREIVLMSLR